MRNTIFYPITIFLHITFNCCKEQKNENSGTDYFFVTAIFVSTIAISMIIRQIYIRRKLLDKEKEYENESDLSKESIIQRFEISKQLLIMNSSPIIDLNEKKILTRVNEIFYGQSDVDLNEEIFYILLNAVHNNFSMKLSKRFSKLNEDEIHICCLMKAGFNTSDICFILRYAPITIRIKKTHIRKKIGITDGGDIIDFLDKLLKKQEEEKSSWKKMVRVLLRLRETKSIQAPY